MVYVAVFLVAFLLALVITPLAASLGRRWGLVDVPGGRRQHVGSVPRTGGWALFLPFLAAAALSTCLGPRLPAPEGIDPNESRRLAGVLAGSAFMFLAGLLDDRRELKPRSQLLAQFGAGAIAVAGLLFIERVRNPFSDELIVLPFFLTVLVTLVWVVGMINTVNFLDGLDGLAAGVTGVVAIVLFIHMYQAGQHSVSLLPLALLGCTLGFLPYNWYPARVFMGSTGSFFLGYALATVSVAGGPRLATMMLLLLVPVVDVGWLILLRSRRSGTFVLADRRHLHFRLVDLGYSQRQVVVGYMVLSAVFGIVALVVASRVVKLVALVALAGVVALALALLAKRSEP